MNTSQRLLNDQLMVTLERCYGSCNTLDNPSSRIYFPNKIEEEYFNIFITITGISEIKTLIKHIWCNGRYKFDGGKCNSNQKLNNGKGRCECKNPIKYQLCKIDYVWHVSKCECNKYYEIDKYLNLALA